MSLRKGSNRSSRSSSVSVISSASPVSFRDIPEGPLEEHVLSNLWLRDRMKLSLATTVKDKKGKRKPIIAPVSKETIADYKTIQDFLKFYKEGYEYIYNSTIQVMVEAPNGVLNELLMASPFKQMVSNIREKIYGLTLKITLGQHDSPDNKPRVKVSLYAILDRMEKAEAWKDAKLAKPTRHVVVPFFEHYYVRSNVNDTEEIKDMAGASDVILAAFSVIAGTKRPSIFYIMTDSDDNEQWNEYIENNIIPIMYRSGIKRVDMSFALKRSIAYPKYSKITETPDTSTNLEVVFEMPFTLNLLDNLKRAGISWDPVLYPYPALQKIVDDARNVTGMEWVKKLDEKHNYTISMTIKGLTCELIVRPISSRRSSGKPIFVTNNPDTREAFVWRILETFMSETMVYDNRRYMGYGKETMSLYSTKNDSITQNIVGFIDNKSNRIYHTYIASSYKKASSNSS